MIHCNGLVNVYNEDKEKAKKIYIDFEEEEKPFSAQLVGSDPQYLSEATQILSKYADIIDINFGCPESNILAGKAGAFFSKHPEQMDKVLNAVLENTKHPVTAKIRTGWDEKNINAVEVCKKLEDFGIAAVAIHGRTKKQGYSGKADWNIIKKAKGSVNIPVIGNGDIFKPGTAKFCLEKYGVDFIMIGRASLGNPFIFKRTLALLEKGEKIEEPTKEEKMACFLEFLKLYERQKRQSFSELRDHALWFTKGIEGSRELRNKMVKLQTKEELLELLKKI